jgi:hypothetical protein
MGMDSHGDDARNSDVDELVRRALTAPPHVAPRVVAAALRGDSRPGGRVARVSRRALAAAAAVSFVAIATALLLWRPFPPPVPPARGLMTNVGDIIVIKTANRPITLIDPGAAASTTPPGTSSIVLLGEAQ